LQVVKYPLILVSRKFLWSFFSTISVVSTSSENPATKSTTKLPKVPD